jgi:hypothetical protein
VRKHFNSVIKRIDRPLMILIDDVDRCRQSSVVALLESIHTLYNHSNVFYIVAAERTWISSCFESEYGSLGTRQPGAGRPLGHLFLEKVFRLAIPVPVMSEALKHRYARHLLSGESTAAFLQAERRLIDRARSALAKAETEDQIQKVIAEAPPDERYAYARAGILRSATEAVQRSAEHRLQRFVRFIEPNPRAMKLVVAAYGIYVAYAMASGLVELDSAKRDQIALFTILSLRWPTLVEYLTEHPDRLAALKQTSESDPIPAGADPLEVDAFRLARKDGVKAVLAGEGLDQGLEETMLRMLVG